MSNEAQVIAEWKAWHRELVEVLDCEVVVRAVTLQKAKTLRTQLAAWKEMAEARNALLVCYRIERRPSGKLMKRLDKAREAIDATKVREG